MAELFSRFSKQPHYSEKQHSIPEHDSYETAAAISAAYDAQEHRSGVKKQSRTGAAAGSADAGAFVEHAPSSQSTVQNVEGVVSEKKKRRRGDREDGRHELQEEEAYEALGFSYPGWRKWTILSVIFAVQCSMNYNAAVYANGVTLLQDKFDISAQAARVGQCVFLICYALGCELWAPWSEELGRWPILQTSLFLVNIWQILAALAPNFGSVVVARVLGGFSSAGGSVTLGMVADMWDPNEQQWAVAFVVFSSVGGSVIGPLVGPFIEAYLTWEWICWTQLIFGGFVQLLHFFLVPETRSTILLDREAKRRRAAGETNVYGPNELKEHRFTAREVIKTWTRPFVMFATEPIVLCLSLLSGFSDALIFTFMDAFTPVYEQWGFSSTLLATTFVPVAIGYFLAYASYIWPLYKQRRQLRRDPEGTPPEIRLWWLLFTAPLEPIGLIIFAWTSLGPPRTHWIGPMIASALVGIANFSIYMSTIDYMVAAYGPYAASATGGNGFARDALAGIAAMYSSPFYDYFKSDTLEWPTTILACISLVVTVPVFVFYFHGAWFRERSRFAQSLSSERKERHTAKLTRSETIEREA